MALSPSCLPIDPGIISARISAASGINAHLRSAIAEAGSAYSLEASIMIGVGPLFAQPATMRFKTTCTAA